MADVAVVVPAYQVEALLPRCLESLRAQTLSDLEILVVDDGSRDGTRDVIEEQARKDHRVRPIFLDANRGTFAARNAGIAAAEAPYVGFLDADDRAYSGMFRLLYDAAREVDAGIVIGNVMRILPDGERRPQTRLRGPETITDGIYERFVRLGFGSGFLFNKLYRRDLLTGHRVTSRDDRITRNEDYLVNLACFSAARRVHVLPDVLLDHFDREGSTTSGDSAASGFVEILEAYRRALEVFADATEEVKRGIDTLYAAQLRFDDYRVRDATGFDSHRERVATTIGEIARLRPGFLHELLRHRPPAAGGPLWLRALRRLLGRGRS